MFKKERTNNNTIMNKLGTSTTRTKRNKKGFFFGNGTGSEGKNQRVEKGKAESNKKHRRNQTMTDKGYKCIQVHRHFL